MPQQGRPSRKTGPAGWRPDPKIAGMNLIFNFSAPSPRDPAIKQVGKALSQAGCPVASATFDTKSSRRSGIEFRTVCLVMADGQRVELGVKSSGDVFEVRINGSVVPLFKQGDAAGAAKEIAARLTAGRDKFQKRMASAPVDPVPSSARTARRRMLDVLTEQRNELAGSVAQAKVRLQELSGQP